VEPPRGSSGATDLKKNLKVQAACFGYQPCAGGDGKTAIAWRVGSCFDTICNSDRRRSAETYHAGNQTMRQGK
jgi:hypothetical protein